jgi:tetratricopeptide (TPR) repeat protein
VRTVVRERRAIEHPVIQMTLCARAAALTMLALVGAATAVHAQRSHGAPERLGTVHFPISCASRAQSVFDTALALLHHMTYPRARSEFLRVAALDPGCAMAHWGVAMTLFQPLWPTRPSPDDIRLGRDEIGRARASGVATAPERLFIEAAGAFFDAPDSVAYWERIHRWQAALERVHSAIPSDPEGEVWLALADLAVAPPSDTSHRQSDRAAALLLDVYRRNPDHPGAMHYLIHADDVPGREHDSPEIVRRYEAMAPQNPHALHMPTHIYTRLGEWPQVIRGNLRAADAALRQPAGEGGRYVWDEFPHAVEYLVYASLQIGADDAALRQIRRLRRNGPLEPTFKSAFHTASTAARYALERHAWEEARTLRPRDPPAFTWDRYPWAEAVTWFARGLGAARERRPGEADSARARLAALEAASIGSGEELFSRQITMLRLSVEGWMAQASGEPDSAVALLRQASALEAITPKPAVTPAPTLPADEMLGDLLMEQRHAADALAAYRRALERYPNRLNSLLGAARAARASGDSAAAADFYREVMAQAGHGSRRAGVTEARAFASAERRSR